MSPAWSDRDTAKGPTPMTRKFFTACLLVLGGVLALSVAVELLTQIRWWLLAAATVIALGWTGLRVYRWRRDRW